jgi:hypothetical protein
VVDRRARELVAVVNIAWHGEKAPAVRLPPAELLGVKVGWQIGLVGCSV